MGTIVVTSSHSLRINWRGTGRPMKGLWNVHNTAIHRTRRPSHPCGSIMTGVRACPRGVAPIKHYPALRDNPGVAYGRNNGIITPSFLGMRAQTAVLFSPPHNGFPILDDPCKLLV